MNIYKRGQNKYECDLLKDKQHTFQALKYYLKDIILEEELDLAKQELDKDSSRTIMHFGVLGGFIYAI